MAKIYIGTTLISDDAAAYTKAQSDQNINDLIAGAPEALNTLNAVSYTHLRAHET